MVETNERIHERLKHAVPNSIMSKSLKEETNQLSITDVKGFMITNTTRNSRGQQKRPAESRSSSLKRKNLTQNKEDTREPKKQITSPDITRMSTENTTAASNNPININIDVLKALELLLEPLRSDIKALTTSHREIKNDMKDTVTLNAENCKLMN